jgi:hypothetical protein
MIPFFLFLLYLYLSPFSETGRVDPRPDERERLRRKRKNQDAAVNSPVTFAAMPV